MLKPCTKIFFSISLILFFPHFLKSQEVFEGVINFYEKAIGFTTNCNELTLSKPTSFKKEDLVLIIQMTGAEIDVSNSVNFGTITDYRSAGFFEYARVISSNGNSVQLAGPLKNDYEFEYQVQVVFIPELSSGSILRNIECPPWDGELGGIIAVKSYGELIIQGTLSASYNGFRGGGMVEFISTNANRCREMDYVASFDDNIGSQKGEGIAPFIANKDYGRGKQSNGGGGGNIHNAGGGGGSNFGAGGMGGDEWVRCSNPPLKIGGIGGQPLNYNEKKRIFLGGGGGGGNENDNGGTIGASGGGIVIVEAESINSMNGKIEANGADQTLLAVLDSGGGGGGGGSILINADRIDGQLTIEAKGGYGGRIDEPSVRANYVWGPGGGGGGGLVGISEGLSLQNVNINLQGGEQGYYICCPQWTWGSMKGEDGGIMGDFVISPPSYMNIDSVTICEGGFYNFKGEQISEEGVYFEILESNTGCDSIIVLNLEIGDVHRETQSFTFCEGYEISIRGEIYDIPGQYILTFPGNNECDSLITLDISIKPGSQADLFETICEGEFFTIGNSIFSESGIYSTTLISRNGCDSLVTLNLSVIQQQAEENFFLSTCSDLDLNDFLDCTANSIWYTGIDSLIWQPPIDLIVTEIFSDTLFISECYESGCLFYSANYNVSFDSSRIVTSLSLDEEYFLCKSTELELFLTGFEFYNWNNQSFENYFLTDEPNLYFVAVLDSNSCFQRHVFRVYPCFEENRFVPNIFTPNGDGINDDFRMYGAYADNYIMQIYDRWGNLIFESNNFFTGWDGTRNGQMLNPGVYVYKIEFDQPFLDLDEIKVKRSLLAGEVILYR